MAHEPLEQRTLLAAGALDTTFGEGGLVTTDFLGSGSDYALDTVIVPGVEADPEDDQILVLGASSGTGKGHLILARYNADGALDLAFGQDIDGDGTPDGVLNTGLQSAGALAIDGERILVAGDDGGSVVLLGYTASGILDLAFGTEGQVRADFGVYFDLEDMVVSGESLVVAGSSSRAETSRDFAVARFDLAGTLDTTFGEDPDGDGIQSGISFADFGGAYDQANALAVASDGSIVVAGRSGQGDPRFNDFALARFDADGHLNTAFDQDGTVVTHFGATDTDRSIDEAVGVAFYGEQIVVAGRALGVGISEFAVARYNGDGSLDENFGQSGKTTTLIGPSYCQAEAMVLDDLGRILVAGYSPVSDIPNTDFDFALVRYTVVGELDPAFGQAGIVTTDLGSTQEAAYSLALGPDGIVLAGRFIHANYDADFAMARYTYGVDGSPDGSLDLSFGNGGIAISGFLASADDQGSDVVATLPDGKILVVGTTEDTSGQGDFALARYNSDGSLDVSFGQNGRVTTDFNSQDDTATAVAVDSQGRIVVVGGSGWCLAVARYNADGSLDMNFGEDGKILAELDFERFFSMSVAGVAIESDDQIVVAGSGDRKIVLVRYNQEDGSLDGSFGQDGKVLTDLENTSVEVSDLAISADGKILVAATIGGDLWYGGGDFGLIRYKEDGMLDTTFGGDGIVTTDFAVDDGKGIPLGGSSDNAAALAIDDNGNIVVVGSTGNGADFAMARYDSSGNLDTTFGQDLDLNGSRDGKVITGFVFPQDDGTEVASQDVAADVVIDSQDRIVVVGSTYVDPRRGSGSGFAIARYDDFGDLDASFGQQGKVTTDFVPTAMFLGEVQGAHAVSLDGDERILVAGFVYRGWQEAGTGYDFALARYLGDAAPTPDDLQDIIDNLPPDTTEVEVTGNPNDLDAWITAIGGDGTAENPGLPPNTSGEVITITLALENGNYGPVKKLDVPEGYEVVIDGASGIVVIEGGSPALTLGSGSLLVQNGVTFTNTTTSPTILVTGGSLTLRDTIVEETSDGAFAAIEVSGGTLDLGQADDLGGNTINVRGAGEAIRNTSTNPISALGNIFQIDDTTLASPFDIEDVIYHKFDWASVGEVSYLSENVAPRVNVGADRIVEEGEVVSITGQFDELNLSDTHTFLWEVSADNGQVIAAGSGEDFSFTPDDNGVYTLTYTVTDDDSGVGTDTAVITVNNVAPTINSFTGPDPSYAVRGLTLDFSGEFTDAGSADTHTATLDWGDGASEEIDPATSPVTSSHVYTDAADYAVTLTVTDDDGGEVFQELGVTVYVVAMQEDHCAGGQLLAVGGTLDDDHIVFRPGENAGDVVVEMNDVVYGPFQPTGRIMAFAQAGNDHVQVAGSIDLSAWLYGDEGNDRLKGGAGHDVLLGELGDDLLVGQSGRDILVGGWGSDRIVGNADDDILIAGYLDFGDRDAALCAIMQEWISERTYDERRDNIRGAGTGDYDDYFLLQDDVVDVGAATVFDDNAKDTLTGSAGTDWFFANLELDGEFDDTKDKITDLKAYEFAEDLDFILEDISLP